MFTTETDHSIPLYSLDRQALDDWLKQAEPAQRRWVESSGFQPTAGKVLLVPDESGGIAAVLSGRGEGECLWALAHLPGQLPAGDYHLAGDWSTDDEDRQEKLLIGWGLGCYRFDRYKRQPAVEARLVLPDSLHKRVTTLVDASAMIRDLVNTPALDLGPAELAAKAGQLAKAHECRVRGQLMASDWKTSFRPFHVVGPGLRSSALSDPNAVGPTRLRRRWRWSARA